jgi:hypothetical protein
MNDLIPLKDFTPAGLELWIQEAGQPAYRARQLLKWIYSQNVEDFQEMTDVSKDVRGWLEQHARIPSVMREKVLTDKDGTRKLLFRLLDGERIESVLIDEERRLTLCVSSQVGCALGCRFCLTGEQGYRRNLSAGEIVDQICAARRELGPEERITNLVFRPWPQLFHQESYLVHSWSGAGDARVEPAVSYKIGRISACCRQRDTISYYANQPPLPPGGVVGGLPSIGTATPSADYL